MAPFHAKILSNHSWCIIFISSLLNLTSASDTKTGCTITYGEYDFIEGEALFEQNICAKSPPTLREDMAE